MFARRFPAEMVPTGREEEETLKLRKAGHS